MNDSVTPLQDRLPHRPKFHFHGGLHLDDRKALSSDSPIQKVPVPDELIFPLRQHSHGNNDAMVKVGQEVLLGQAIARPVSALGTYIHASSSGVVTAIEDRPIPHGSGLADECIIIKTDGRDESIVHDSCPSPFSQEPNIVSDCIMAAGVVGLGGAVFPTWAKIRRNPSRASAPIHTLLINAAECEPYITCDDRLIRERASDIIDGIRILAHALEVEHCIIAIEDNKPEALLALQAALDPHDQIELFTVPTLYPSGGERQLIFLLTGKEVPSGGLPLDLGIVCVNVGTAWAVYNALRNVQPLISRIVTITGEGVHKPGNFEARIGTPISVLIEAAGGYTEKVKHLFLGGPMMGISLPSDELPVVKASNCVIAAAEGEFRHQQAAMPCIRCSFCVHKCPVNLLPQELYWHSRAREYDKADKLHVFDCIECGICADVCPSHIPLVDYFRHAKSALRAEQFKADLAERALQRFEAREARLAREKAERAKRMAEKRAALKNKAAKDPGSKAASS